MRIVFYLFFIAKFFSFTSVYGVNVPTVNKDNIKKVKEYISLKKDDEAFKILKEEVKSEDPEAQLLMGILYLENKNDSKTGAKWLEKAAKQDNALAAIILGGLYLDGDGVKLDKKKGLFWLYKVAQHENKEDKNENLAAKSLIGMFFYKENKYSEALSWFLASESKLNSQYHLGIMFFKGFGVPLNHEKAFHYFEKAALQDYSYAQLELGIMYFNGEFVSQDYVKAASWITKAAQQENGEAQFKLGCLYNDGMGVERNQKQARFWFARAAVNKNERAAQMLYSMYREGTLPMLEGYGVENSTYLK